MATHFFPIFSLCFFTNIVSVCVLLLCGLLVCMCVCVICDFFNGFYVLVAYLWLSASGPFVDCTCVCFIYVCVHVCVRMGAVLHDVRLLHVVLPV